MKRYAVNSQYNMRDLGGYTVKDNIYTAYGNIIRSDYPSNLTFEEINTLKSLNIGCVIDLRTRKEAEFKPSFFKEKKDFNYYNVSFKNGNGISDKEKDIPYTYLKMMEEANTIRKILKIISKSKSSVLYHCAIGKDRTGIVSAIILGICQVPEKEIIVDYQVSDTFLHELLEKFRNQNPKLDNWVGRSKPDYMRKTLKLLKVKYGSFGEYLKAIGINEKIINKIRKKLL
ncbi:MAG: tyrosine-protein phosphatase [Bacillota bacterium]